MALNKLDRVALKRAHEVATSTAVRRSSLRMIRSIAKGKTGASPKIVRRAKAAIRSLNQREFL